MTWSNHPTAKLLRDPIIVKIVKIAESHGKTSALVVLRRLIQEGLSAIPETIGPDYIRDNIRIFDFELTDAEMQTMHS